MIIMGIDPGFAITGYGVIEKTRDKNKIIDYGIIQTSSSEQFCNRIKTNHEELNKLIKKFKPDIFAIEELFFAQNTKTAINVAQSRGVLILTAIQNNLEIYEFTPLQIKQAMTGYGRATKKQIQEMTKLFLNLKKIPKPDDAADALAVAITCSSSYKNLKMGI
ncbi:MAG TPA: crossover junction endodeoxyribonuclease RuvC [bacterium]|nr:crossover junction endodeoxyribonuclease RuvC [bacterium]